jgi:molecular chaperone GrpE
MKMEEGMQDEHEHNSGAAENLREPANDTAAVGASFEERLAAAEAELADYKDRLLRAVAEAENVRRRTQREKDEAVKYAAGKFAKDLLPVADNLGRALASVPEGQVTDEMLKNLLVGVAATERELMSVLERHAVRRISPKGERFDHNFHQAIYEVENTGKPAGTVVEVLQDGYALHDRLLRPAMVGVAKGEAKPAAPGGRVDTVA